jgi:hypothetical protein
MRYGNGIRLSRARRFRSNIFKPFLYGKFREKGGKTTLSGRFVMHPLTTLIIAFFYCSFAVLSILFFLAWLGDPNGSSLAEPLSGPIVIVLFTGFVWVLKWLSRDDAQWISARIGDALSNK